MGIQLLEIRRKTRVVKMKVLSIIIALFFGLWGANARFTPQANEGSQFTFNPYCWKVAFVTLYPGMVVGKLEKMLGNYTLTKSDDTQNVNQQRFWKLNSAQLNSWVIGETKNKFTRNGEAFSEEAIEFISSEKGLNQWYFHQEDFGELFPVEGGLLVGCQY